jgi:fructose/tagatose bisphosphate aldolase
MTMPLISDPQQVAAIYERAAECGLCLANFCTSNPYTTEAILRAAYEFGQEHNLEAVPMVVSSTANYPIESQLASYTHLKDVTLGIKALVDDVELLVSPGSPYAGLSVMLHLDHGQPEADEALFEWAADKYGTIMYDASDWPMDTNIEMTRRFVERMRGRVLVEGAVAEIAQAAEHADVPLTAPEDAERFYHETGVFLIVPDLGTEHRATAIAARYDSERAREITTRIGKKSVLHGASSLPDSDLRRLPADGIVKVNVWTIFERLGGQAVARHILDQLPHILPADERRALVERGILGPRMLEGEDSVPRLDSLREESRRDVWQAAVVARMKFYLENYNYGRWRPL